MLEPVKKHVRSKIDLFYEKYKYLAEIYAFRVFNFERTGMTREDIIQEMRIKIYTSILGYARNWRQYRETKLYKPVPMEYFLRRSLVNKVIDFAKMFNQERIENQNKLSIFESTTDVAIYTTTTMNVELHADKVICELNGVDLLMGLKDDRRKCYCMFVYGFPLKELSFKFPEIDVKNFIDNHNNFLRQRRAVELYDFESKVFEVTHYEEA